MMNRKIKLAAVLAVMLSVSPLQAAEEQQQAAAQPQISIAAVNVPYVMNEIPQAKASKEALIKEFGPRQEELQKLETEGKGIQQTLPTLKGEQLTEAQRRLAQMQSDFNLKGRALQEDQEKRIKEEELRLGRLVQQAIDTIAKERGLQMVIRGEAITFATRSVDISDEVVARVTKMAENADKKGNSKSSSKSSKKAK